MAATQPEDRTRSASQRLFVLDTNVLIHDPTALFRFQEHDLHLPMRVLEELDQAKKGVSEVASSARQVSRLLAELMHGASKPDIDRGLPLPSVAGDNGAGRLYFQTGPVERELPVALPGGNPDNGILTVAMALQQTRPDAAVTLVSKDINLRIKAAVVGIHAEDYHTDRVLDDVDLLYAGTAELDPDFGGDSGQEMTSWEQDGRTYYRVDGKLAAHWYPNQCLFAANEEQAAFVVRSLSGDGAVLQRMSDYSGPTNSVWGITARNQEQNFALNLLLDPAVDFLTLVGAAGTGKTLLALAAGLQQTMDERRYREIIMTRVTVPVGEDIGFLPGTEEEKMTPWMGALLDNLEVLTESVEGGEWGRAATRDLLNKRIKIHSLNFMRGRTFQSKFLIIDEAQNLTAKQMKTLVTRAGPGTKVVCIGNISQIDTPYLSETTSGLTYIVDRFKSWAHSGHVTLLRGERSRLAEFASETL